MDRGVYPPQMYGTVVLCNSQEGKILFLLQCNFIHLITSIKEVVLYLCLSVCMSVCVLTWWLKKCTAFSYRRG